MENNLFTIGSEEGLPNLQVHAIELDILGRLWIVGPSGLSCYNGNSIKVYDTRNGLICSGLRTLKIQNDSLIWIGTDRGIELMTIEGEFIQLHFNFDWIYGIAECFLFFNDFIWVGTSNGLLKLEYNQGHVNLISALDFGLVSKLQSHNDSVLALTSKEGLITCKNGKTETLFNNLFDDAQITCFEQTIDRQFFIGTTNGLFVTTMKGEIRNHYFASNNAKRVNDIAVINDKWVVAFTNQLKIIQQENLNITELETISIISSIKMVISDTYDNIWVGTNNAGIKKVSVLRNAIKKIDCGDDEAVFSTHFSSNKKQLYIGGEGFFSVLSKKAGENIPKLEDYINTKTIVWDSLIDSNNPGLMWFATQDGIYSRYQNDSFVKDLDIAETISVPTRALLKRNDEIFIGTISGLFCMKNGNIQEVLTNAGSKFGYVYSLSLNQDNKIWVSCLGQGLWMESSDGFVNLVDDNLVELGNTYCVDSHPSGNTIVLQQENVILLNEKLESKIIYKEFPIGGWAFTWVDEQTIAVGTDNGLNIININEVDVGKKINLYLDKSKWQSTSSRSILHHTNNKLYYGLISGLYFIDLNEIERITVSPIVRLNYCKWTNANPEIENNTYSLPFGKWRVSIDVYSAWYLDERQVSFRFKLAGFDETWSKLSSKSTINYNSLPEGSYELFVQAFTPLTGFGEANSLVNFVVTKTKKSFSKSFANVLSKLKLNNASTLKNKLLLEQNELFKKELDERTVLEAKFKKYKDQLESLVLQRTDELKIQKEKAEFADQQKSIFLASMSHEIRTPLSGVIGLVDLLHDTGLTQTQIEYLEKIENSSKHLLEVINNILDITKIESGQTELDLIPFSISKLLDDLAEFSQIKVENKRIDMIIDETIRTKHLLIGDPLRIKQVLINLLGNALKFTETGSILLKVTELETNSDKAVLQFAVEDTGIGMTEEQVKKLFVAFEQGDKSTAREYGGSGLGLNISHNYVDMMGGVLKAESTPNKGTSFNFTIAFDKSKDLDQNYKSNLLPSEFTDKSVIIINDNILELNIMLRQLKGIGLNPVGVKTAKEAIAKFKEESFDVIFMDWYRPDLKGSETIKALKKHSGNNTKIVVLNSSNKAHLLVQLEPLNINQVLIKPISQEKFRSEIINSFNENIKKQKLSVSKNKISDKRKEWNSNINILIAEDNKTNQLVIKKTLEREGYQTAIASNGKECVTILESNPNFDIVLMDIQMPEMDGIEATTHIRSTLKLVDIPIIAFTADVTKEMKNKITKFGMNSYVSKPIDLAELHTVLDHYLIDIEK